MFSKCLKFLTCLGFLCTTDCSGLVYMKFESIFLLLRSQDFLDHLFNIRLCLPLDAKKLIVQLLKVVAVAILKHGDKDVGVHDSM